VLIRILLGFIADFSFMASYNVMFTFTKNESVSEGLRPPNPGPTGDFRSQLDHCENPATRHAPGRVTLPSFTWPHIIDNKFR